MNFTSGGAASPSKAHLAHPIVEPSSLSTQMVITPGLVRCQTVLDSTRRPCPHSGQSCTTTGTKESLVKEKGFCPEHPATSSSPKVAAVPIDPVHRFRARFVDAAGPSFWFALRACCLLVCLPVAIAARRPVDRAPRLALLATSTSNALSRRPAAHGPACSRRCPRDGAHVEPCVEATIGPSGLLRYRTRRTTTLRLTWPVTPLR